jgi:hypothetical protein
LESDLEAITEQWQSLEGNIKAITEQWQINDNAIEKRIKG